MSLLSKILGNAQPSDEDDDTPIKSKYKQIKLDNLKVGDTIIIEQTVRVVDKHYALDKRLGSIGAARTVYLVVKGINGVCRNVVAVASGPENAKVSLANVAREPNNPKPRVVVEARAEDEMHGDFSLLGANRRDLQGSIK